MTASGAHTGGASLNRALLSVCFAARRAARLEAEELRPAVGFLEQGEQGLSDLMTAAASGATLGAVIEDVRRALGALQDSASADAGEATLQATARALGVLIEAQQAGAQRSVPRPGAPRSGVLHPVAATGGAATGEPLVETGEEHRLALVEVFERRRRLLAHATTATRDDLAATEALLWSHLDALLWAPPAKLAEIDPASDPADAFAAALPLLSQAAVPRVHRTLAAAVDAPPEVCAAVMTAAALSPSSAVGELLESLAGDAGASATVRAEALRALIDREEATSTLLAEALASGEDSLALVACDGVVRHGDREMLRTLEQVAEKATDWPLRGAALRAAAVLGSAWALAEARSWAGQGAAAELIDVLAVAGDDRDVELLAELAEADGLTGRAVIALGWLAHPRAGAFIDRWAGDEDIAPEVISARFMLAPATRPAARSLYSAPWSVATVLDLAQGGAWPLLVAELARLEVSSRLGIKSALPVLSSAVWRQDVAAMALRRVAEPEASRYPAGTWLFGGRRTGGGT